MVVNGQKGSHNDEGGILGEGGRRKEKERKGKERKGTEGAAVDINSKFGPFFFIFLFLFFLFGLLRGGIIIFFFQSS